MNPTNNHGTINSSISQEEIERIIATSRLACSKEGKAQCKKVVWVSFFFDGTNNNRDRDLVIPVRSGKSRNQCSHSNIAALFDACYAEEKSDIYKYYIPGVGTIFKEIGELEPNSKGLSLGEGGPKRISYAFYQLCNSIIFAKSKSRLFLADDYLDELPVHYNSIAEYEASLYRRPESVPAVLNDINMAARRLSNAIASNKGNPVIEAVNVAVFGFSRGAAEARAFCRWLEITSKYQNGQWLFAGCIPIRLYFLGLFDTVCSVAAGHSAPYIGRTPNKSADDKRSFADGQFDWGAPKFQQVTSFTQCCRHYVAAHEVRYSFPVTSIRNADGSMPAGAVELLFPGAHSDVGGGYGPGDQGKSVGGRHQLLPQIPLLKMYEDARKAGVPLMSMQALKETREKVSVDFQCDPDLLRRFAAYMAWVQGSPDNIQQLAYLHLQHYWRWRLAASRRFMQLHCMQQLQAGTTRGKRADRQDLEDMQASERDWIEDGEQARSGTRSDPEAMDLRGLALEKQLLDLHGIISKARIPADVDELFDRHVHDSHASFYVLGPSTRWQRQQKIAEVHIKHARYQVARATWNRHIEKRDPPQLSAYEQRILDATPTEGGKLPRMIDDSNFPVLRDADYRDLGEGLPGVIGQEMSHTRREIWGHVHQRSTFVGPDAEYARTGLPVQKKTG